MRIDDRYKEALTFKLYGTNKRGGGGRDMTKSIPKIICGAFTIYLSLVILIGYYLDYVGFSLTAGRIILPLLVIFICYMGFKFISTHKHTLLSYEFDKTYTIIFFIILIVTFIYFLLPSFPSFLPLGSNVDAPQAYAISKLIADGHSLLWHGHIYSEYQPFWNVYPFGFHLNVAVLSWISNIPPIKLIYPFACLIIAMSIAAVYGIVVESKITENKYLAAIPSFLLVTFVLLNLQMRIGGTWPMLFGIFLIVMFMWFLMDYLHKPSFLSMIPLILIQCAINIGYYRFAVIPIAVFFFALIFDSRRRYKIYHFFVFSGIVLILTLPYLITSYEALTSVRSQVPIIKHAGDMPARITPFRWWQSDESVWVNLSNIVATLFYIVSVLGAVKYFNDKKVRAVSLFYWITILNILLFAALLLLINLRYVYIDRTYYILMYPTAIFIFLGIKKYLDTEDISKKSSAIAFICMILLTFATAPVMSLGCSSGLTGREAGITQNEYDTALWVKNNIEEDVAVITDPGAQWFFFVASEQKNITLVHSSYEHLDKEFKMWQEQAKSGDIVVVLDIYKVGSAITLRQNNTVSIDDTTYEIIYHMGVCYVLRRH